MSVKSTDLFSQIEEINRFRELCRNNDEIPLFLTAQWLDVVAKDSWGVVNEIENDKIIAFFVFKLIKRYGFTILVTPELTQYSGLYFLDQFADSKDKIGKQNKITESIINKLFLFSDKISISFHPSVSNLLPFYWAGFELHVRYNYIINFTIQNHDLFDKFDTNIKKNIRKMSKLYELFETDNYSDFIDRFGNFLNNRGLILGYSRKLFLDLANIEMEGYVFKSFYLKNKLTNRVSALGGVIIYKSSAYFLIQGHDVDAENEIIIYLSYLILRELEAKVEIFSFNGSMIKSIERRNRKMGANQSLYYQIAITKNKLLKAIEFIKKLSLII